MNAKLVRDAIERLRLKLLDLTNRNRLLNFKFSDSSRKFVRIVDELPSALYERLVDEESASRKLYFAALPEPPSPSPQASQPIEAGAARSTFGDGPPKSVSSRAKGDVPRINIVEWARQNGINPEFELPKPSGRIVGRHTDNQIQTLLLPEMLERRLAALREDSVLAQQELGLGTLFVAFGFLEWYESSNGEEPLYSPLFLLPVRIDRELKQHRYRYFIECGEGSDPTINISLRERLARDFSLALPEIGEDDGPEGYMARIEKAIRSQRRWVVRRFAVVGHFSFARLIMYEDLGPDRWGEGTIERNPLVRTLLEGSEASTSESHAPLFDVDEELVERAVPVLISDADSSQFSAIIDAMQGRSFALKGPPGTGKSQTITNLIAAALASGKRVLFVAEKQAALEVVSKRLSDAGLGPYLLELHSTKIQKKRLLQGFDERLKTRSRRADGRLEETLAQLRKTRAELKWYVTLLNSNVGRSGLTLHDVYWSEQRARRHLDTREIALARTLESIGSLELSAYEQVEREQLVERLARAFAVCAETGGNIEAHPMWGLESPGLGATGQDLLRSQLGEWDAALDRLERVIARSATMFACALPQNWLGLHTFSTTVAALPAVLAGTDPAYLSRVRSSDDLELLANLESVTRRRFEARAALATYFEDLESTLGNAQVLDSAASSLAHDLEALGVADVALDEVLVALASKAAELRRTKAALQVLGQATGKSGLQAEMTALLFGELAEATKLVRTVRPDVLRARSLALFEPEAHSVLTQLTAQAHELRKASDSISSEMIVNYQERPEDLKARARVLRETHPMLRLFSGPYRAAKRRFMHSSKSVWRDSVTAAEQLDALADLNIRRAVFEADPRLHRLAGAHSRGLDTPFDVLSGVTEYWRTVRGRWPTLDPIRAPVQQFLLTADSALLDELTTILGVDDLTLVTSFVAKWSASSVDSAASLLQDVQQQLEQVTAAATPLARLRYRTPVLSSSAAWLFAELEALRKADLAAQKLADKGGFRVPAATDAEFKRIESTHAMARAFFSSALPAEMRALLLSEKATVVRSRLQQFGRLIADGLAKCEGIQRDLTENQGLAIDRWLRGVEATDPSVGAMRTRLLEAAGASEEAVDEWAIARDLVREANRGGLDRVAAAVWDGFLAPLKAGKIYQLAYYRSLIRAVTVANPRLPAWTGEHLHALRARLGTLDIDYLKTSRAAVVAGLTQRSVPAGVSHGAVGQWSERSLIEREAGKQKRHIAIRDLMHRAGGAALALKPCFMMSPASVAQFLSPVPQMFDLVIIDEASQMRPEDALGAIARGQQTIVVGDPMQLPPTTFFDAVRDEPDLDEEELEVDTESVLDLALGSFRPSRELLWHYRSKHHSLIAFSNKEFYDERLIVFPSPAQRAEHLGVQHVYVENGLYQASLNAAEAEALVASVGNLMRQCAKSSIGVVAINQPQKELLIERFDRLFAEDDELEAYRTAWQGTLEPFFVKNLENVQGDERDIIVISTVYGPSSVGGSVFQRFGPINSRMGHRRLNVLFTRAKERVIVVTSLRPEDVKLQAGSSPGVIALKRYLEFARSGRLEMGTAGDGGYESPFEAEVAEVLRSLGYHSTPQVGVAGFFIDLGVRHPVNSDHFILGIECDGASYHSAKSARDRDRLRQEILERLGWSLYRIWSTDWFRARSQEIKRLSQHLANLSARTH